MSRGDVSKQDEDPRPAWFLLLLFGALLVFGGDVMLESMKKPIDAVERTGVLLNATDSRGRFGNNTTLIIENRYGQQEKFEVGSTIEIREVSRIRDKARSLIGEPIVYLVSIPAEELLSVHTLDGEQIVTRKYTLEAQQFSSWGLALFGFGFMLLSAIRIVQLGRKKNV